MYYLFTFASFWKLLFLHLMRRTQKIGAILLKSFTLLSKSKTLRIVLLRKSELQKKCLKYSIKFLVEPKRYSDFYRPISWLEVECKNCYVHRSFITKFMNGPLRPSGKEDIYAVVDKYLDYVIHYDQPFVATKYNIQQHIGGDQVSKQIIILLGFFLSMF